MGPFRWNLMTCYMLLVSSKLCMEGKMGPMDSMEPSHPAMELAPASMAYVAFFGLVIPSIGCLDPETLGRYLGGYRTVAILGGEMFCVSVNFETFPKGFRGFLPVSAGFCIGSGSISRFSRLRLLRFCRYGHLPLCWQRDVPRPADLQGSTAGEPDLNRLHTAAVAAASPRV